MNEPAITVLLDPDWARAALVADVRRGLSAVPRSLPPHWLYDERGSELFEQITRLPEYYPTECEREILRDRAGEIVSACGADVVVELGAGTSDKTRTLLDAFHSAGLLRVFVPFDVSEAPLRQSQAELSARYPGVEVRPVVGDYNHHLGAVHAEGHRLVAFLGGTVGNYEQEARAEFLSEVAGALRPGEHLLLGTDLVKSADRLIAAYDDSAGVTEMFIRNVLDVVNRELGADFEQGRFEYVCFWDPTRERVDMRLRSLGAHAVQVPGARLDLHLAAGEEIRIELSSKFRLEGLASELADAGLRVQATWTDSTGSFALTLAERVS